MAEAKRQGKKWLVSCLTAGYTCACLIVFAHIIHIIYVSDISGDPSNSYKPSDQWQCDNVFDAKTIMDWRCMDGGVEGFLNDTDSNVHVLVLSFSLWDHYSTELTGHVILQDNGYATYEN